MPVPTPTHATPHHAGSNADNETVATPSAAPVATATDASATVPETIGAIAAATAAPSKALLAATGEAPRHAVRNPDAIPASAIAPSRAFSMGVATPAARRIST